ncbi:IclR family transcriptional regulator [Marivirga tractuosa]|uniref:Uracil-DNA glycosylase superfamily n=1 Tax=Marivirga tractuosa (strain ATCC 23168 / DSM 4126 / NBRC 15989 / NCIMB 1408 / VKM B-1430 / H-43) TaxID=643867 RepID=E4TM89_MARTH|nr:uracil-DNA glycosylase family protein [Marivirga tractuosa]ADR21365.1 Uracil-DNA glycosylase superfamily [Marivirga tractuosa DSM 4126]BDD14181.1 IclR family transcriptional regulator [Marivirga tractuosa]
MHDLLHDIRNCTECLADLPMGANPIVQASSQSKIAIIGQAPGIAVHQSGIPWDDKSGDNLRNWLGVDKNQFYDEEVFALIPMGLCYPGTGKSGDLAPMKICAPLWHKRLFQAMTEVKLTLLLGKYAQGFYLGKQAKSSLTKTVQSFEEYRPEYLPLPHPSPRNNIWQSKNPWFKAEVLPYLKSRISDII